MSDIILQLRDVDKAYFLDKTPVPVLKQINFSVEDGEYVAIMGPSGSGKSTMMNIIGCLDKQTAGDFIFDGVDVGKCKDRQLSVIRNEKIGFVFQNFALINRYTVYENLEVPLLARNQKNYKNKIMDCLERLGISEYYKSYPPFLSGGQQQRCAIGRALLTDCELLLCDEPTGALDRDTSNEIMDVLCEANEKGKTIVIVTHDLLVAARCKQQIHLEDGKVLI